MIDDETCGNRHDDNLDDGQEHTCHIDVDSRSGIDIGQNRGKEGSEYSGDSRHADRQGHIAFREIGHNIGGSAAGAGSHQNYADGKLRREVKSFSQSESQQRHHGELGDTSYDDVLRTGKNHLKVTRLQRETHSKHDNAEQGIDVGSFDKAYALRRKQGQGGYCDDDDSHILAEEVTEFFQCVHNKSPFKFVGMGREELRKNSAGGILRLQQKNLCLH